MDNEVKDKRVATREILALKAKDLPRRSGCYLMLGEKNKILYIGKAKDLRSRVHSYFKEAVDSSKTLALRSKIIDFEFILTANEAEAYVLENNLVKRHLPKYNIRLKDDKSYPYLVVDQHEPFPRLKYMRRPEKKNKRLIIGPFSTGQHIGHIIATLTKAFKLRDCTLQEFKSRKEPCILYQMQQCSAPCVTFISAENYQRELQKVISYFAGNSDAINELHERMLMYAKEEQFEIAAQVRDQWDALKTFQSLAKQKHAELYAGEEDIDVVSYFVGEEEIDLVLSIFRKGLLLGQKQFHFRPFAFGAEGILETLSSSLIDYYQTTVDTWPEVIYFPNDDLQLMSEAQHWTAVLIARPRLPQFKVMQKEMMTFSLLASEQAQENQRVRLSQDENWWKALSQLKEILSLPQTPFHWECYDIAIWQGQAPTASRITFVNGRAQKENYRHYHLEKREEGNNDFAMMKEVLVRRLSDGDLPNVIIVDGGKGQLNVAAQVIRELNLKIAVVALAKEKNIYTKNKKTIKEERLYILGRSNAIALSRYPELFRLLVQMRDEAHRFARKLHHKQYGKEFLQSAIDGLTQLSKRMRAKLRYACQGDIKQLKKWSVEDIAERMEISLKLAQNVHMALQKLD